MTVEEYLEQEKGSEVRHEFVDGVPLAMAGESRKHHRIARNIVRVLEQNQTSCEIALEAIKVRVTEAGRYRYPDVIVSCDPGNNEYFLENPCFLVEVLSESTALTDQNEKLGEYLRLPSLQRYAMIAQDVRRVTLYWRDPSGWRVEILEDTGEFEIPCLETSITLDQIYAGLEFAS